MPAVPPTDWITSCVRPFDDNAELHLAARQELAERAAHADPGQLAAIAKRFDAIDRSSPKKRTFLYSLPIILSVLLTLVAILTIILPYLNIRGMVGSTFSAPTPHAQANILRPQLSAADHFALFGDTTQPTEELAIKALWQSDPDNPLLYNHYLNQCDPYPSDFLETTARIDPDNGWFLLIAAGELAEDAVARKNRPWSGHRDQRPAVADWDIKDAAKLQEALDLIRRAVSKPRIESYGAGHLRQRLEILPPERDLRSRITRLVHAASTNTRDSFDAMHCADILNAHLWQLGQATDTDGLQAAMPLVETLCRHLNQPGGFFVNQLVTQAICQSTHEHLLESCELAGMTAEASRLRPVVGQFRAQREAQRQDRGLEGDRIRRHAALLTALSSPPTTKFGIAPPTADDMKPGRLADYALVDRASLVLAVLLLCGTVGACLLPRFMQGRLPARLGKRFSHLLTPGDWLWILALGTSLPLLWLLGVTRLTPLGCRDWSLGFASFQPVTTQYAIALALIIAATAFASRWRLGKRAGPLGLGHRRPTWGLLPLAFMALAIPAAGLARYSKALPPLTISASLLTATIICILFLVIQAALAKRHDATSHSATIVILPRALAHTSLLLIALTPLTITAERHWIARDDLGRTSPENLGMGRLEAEATRALRANIQSALDAKP